MSVSLGSQTAGGPSKGPDAWRYFEHQYISFSYNIGPGQTNQDAPGNLIGHNFEPAGGLERGEWAELVTLITDLYLVIRPDGTSGGVEADPIVVDSGFEWQRDISPNFSEVYDETANIGDTSTELAVNFRANQSTKDFSLQYGNMTASASFADDGNGNGGAGDPDHHQWIQEFRHSFGRGPFFDYQDPIRLDADMNLNGNLKGASTVLLAGQSHMVWDLFEDPEADLDQLQDIRPVER